VLGVGLEFHPWFGRFGLIRHGILLTRRALALHRRPCVPLRCRGWAIRFLPVRRP
jgi:hypothetical protein